VKIYLLFQKEKMQKPGLIRDGAKKEVFSMESKEDCDIIGKRELGKKPSQGSNGVQAQNKFPRTRRQKDANGGNVLADSKPGKGTADERKGSGLQPRYWLMISVTERRKRSKCGKRFLVTSSGMYRNCLRTLPTSVAG
jgi:hypothetical protein